MFTYLCFVTFHLSRSVCVTLGFFIVFFFFFGMLCITLTPCTCLFILHATFILSVYRPCPVQLMFGSLYRVQLVFCPSLFPTCPYLALWLAFFSFSFFLFTCIAFPSPWTAWGGKKGHGTLMLAIVFPFCSIVFHSKKEKQCGYKAVIYVLNRKWE